jgi:tripartite-type tricarboxylate transporter receptor subunit TctC
MFKYLTRNPMLKKLLFALLLLPAVAYAWQPERPVVVIVGFAPGSGNELAFRQAAGIVQKNNPKVAFVIENRPGADSVVSQNHMLTVPADGYTVSVPSHMSLFVTNDIWQQDIKKFEYNTFINVVTLGKSPLAVVASERSVINTPDAFVNMIQQYHRPINVAIGGGAHQMAYEYIMWRMGGDRNNVKMIRYPGPLQAVTAVAANDITTTEFGIMPIAVARPLIEGGKVKLLGLTGDSINGMPTMTKAVPGLKVYAGWMVSLPPNTAKDIVDWYQREFGRAIRSQEYQDWARTNCIFTVEAELTPAGTQRYAEELRKNFTPVIPHIKAE